jgi:hypothetical protein
MTITHVDPREVIAAYRSGKTLAQVGEEFGVSAYWVHCQLRKHKIPRRPKGTLVSPESTAMTARVVELRRAGLSYEQIAFVVNTGSTNVRRRLVRAGVMQ